MSGGITTHGLAVNVNNDLQPFEWIVPCAIDHVRMTSVGRELGAEQDMDAFVGHASATGSAEALGRTPVERTMAELGARRRLNHAEAQRMAREEGVSPVRYRMVRTVAVPFMRIWWGLRIEGEEHVPDEGAAIITPNHKSFFDSLLPRRGNEAPAALHGQVRALRGPEGQAPGQARRVSGSARAVRRRGARDGANHPRAG